MKKNFVKNFTDLFLKFFDKIISPRIAHPSSFIPYPIHAFHPPLSPPFQEGVQFDAEYFPSPRGSTVVFRPFPVLSYSKGTS